MKLSYYPGCSLESTAKEYDLSTRSICNALGIELVELKDWVCCGASSAHSTNHTLSITLPSMNIALAQQYGTDLAVPCAACYNILKKADHTLRNDSAMRAKTEEIVGFKYNGKINIITLLEAVTNVGVEKIAGKVKNPLKGLSVVCYYGCLLVRPPEVTRFDNTENPVSLDNIINSLGARAIPWSYKTDCCGASLSLTSAGIVQQMVSRLVEAAREAGADAIVTACPLCQSNLEIRRGTQKDNDLPSFYFTELIGLAMGLPEADKWFGLHMIDPRPLLRSLALMK